MGGIANSDIIKSYLGLLVQGKNDFDAALLHKIGTLSDNLSP